MELNRIIAAVVLVTGSCALAEAQELAARYGPEKTSNPLGEAVFVLLELTNISSSIVRFDDGPCAQRFNPVVPIKQRGMDKLYGCTAGGTVGSCLGSFAELKPREKLSRRYLLPDGLEPDSAGDFDYMVERKITFYARDGSYKVVARQEMSQTFTVRTVEADRSQLKADYAPLLADLQSRDPQRHTIGENAITQHPQEFLEPVILRLSRDPQTIVASIRGLKKLGTDRAKQRLAELTSSDHEEYVRQPATIGLAELGTAAIASSCYSS